MTFSIRLGHLGNAWPMHVQVEIPKPGSASASLRLNSSRGLETVITADVLGPDPSAAALEGIASELEAIASVLRLHAQSFRTFRLDAAAAEMSQADG